MSKVIFNAMILDEKPTGLGIYTKNIIQRLAYKDVIDLFVFVDNQYTQQLIKELNINNFILIKLPNNKLKSFYRNFEFNKLINKLSVQQEIVVYSPTQHGVNVKNVKQIITIHDLMPLFYPEGRNHQYLYYKYFLPKIISRTDKIITVSENTKKDIINNYKVSTNKIKVIYNGYDEPQLVSKQQNIDKVNNKYGIKDYILMVGINYKYKNLHSVIKAYSKIKDNIHMKLVIVGNYRVDYGMELKQLVKDMKLENDVIFIGYVDDEDKHMMYQAANIFIYPSFYEGFGLPLLEAMANGVPVLSSNTSSLPEVAGGCAELFNPKDIDNISEAILKVLNNQDLREEYINNGFENVKKFSWDETVEKIEGIIRSLFDER